jgi:hypothetical protein
MCVCVCAAGEAGDCAYLIDAGEVRIELPNGRELARRGTGCTLPPFNCPVVP